MEGRTWSHGIHFRCEMQQTSVNDGVDGVVPIRQSVASIALRHCDMDVD